MQTLKNDNVLLREIQHPVSATYYNFIVLMQGLTVSFFSISISQQVKTDTISTPCLDRFGFVTIRGFQQLANGAPL